MVRAAIQNFKKTGNNNGLRVAGKQYLLKNCASTGGILHCLCFYAPFPRALTKGNFKEYEKYDIALHKYSFRLLFNNAVFHPKFKHNVYEFVSGAITFCRKLIQSADRLFLDADRKCFISVFPAWQIFFGYFNNFIIHNLNLTSRILY
ncbi:MAG TPA: hypothetical protein VN446_03090, partial [Candidatus Acidoferrum sp.]|nr:hypothetical protein [Candidatus Acidoferrum sp.]